MQMPLYIRDPDVDALAVELQRVTGARTKTEAVRVALERRLAEVRSGAPLRDRIAALRARVRALGEPDAAFDMKAFTDDLWTDG
jgi:antitoxin VapB